MAEHVKIKCKTEKEYEQVKFALDMTAIEYYQKAPGKAIHLCGFDKKKDIEELMEKYGVKKAKVKVEKPDFEKAAMEAEEAFYQSKTELESSENENEDEYER